MSTFDNEKPVVVFLSLLMLTVGLSGCTGNDTEPEPEPEPELADWDVYYVDSGSDLPACGSPTLGRLYYVASTAGFETCTSEGWAFVDLTGPAGPAGTPGSQGPAGTPGSQGPAGEDGSDGADGADGAQGSAGAGGKTALAVTAIESAGSNCADGGLKIEVGVDDNGDGVLNPSEVDHTQYVCNGADGQDGLDGADGQDGATGAAGADGADGQDGADGNDGADGADGNDGSASASTMLTSISSPAASLECTAGGRVMQQGLDNGDGGGTAQNGILESGEVDYTTTYCSKYVLWMVDDICLDCNSNPGRENMEILVGDTLYFSADDGNDGIELWAHDTSNLSTWQVADINSAGNSNPGQYMTILVGDTLYFSADDGNDGRELWAHDTSNHSTWQVADIYSAGNSNPGQYMAILVGDTLYFSAYDSNDGTELWAHDTSNHSTWQVADIRSGSSSSSTPGSYMEILVGDTLYFDAYGSNDGRELWAHDTSNHSTWQVADIKSGPASGTPGQFMEILVGDTLYFSADDGNDGTELWAHDTSNHSTWLVADIYSAGSSNPGSFMAIFVGDTLYFSAYDSNDGTELWAHDTSNHSTWLVADINSAGNSNLGQYMAILVGDTLYFSADDGNDGTELWAHDTSNHSTWQVADIRSGSSSSIPGWYMSPILVGDTLYFDAYGSDDGRELWAHDTSNHSTWQVADIRSGIFSSSTPGWYMSPILVGDTLYFDAYATVDDGRELWAMKIEHSITYH